MTEIISYTSLPKFKFFAPTSLDETLELLEHHQNSVALLAGGTDLLIEMRQRVKTPDVIIDLKKVPDLCILNSEDDKLEIGATTPINKILSLPGLKNNYMALYQSLNDLADDILRYRATIGGNICTASPAADTAGSLMIFQAKVYIKSFKGGVRKISMKDFFTGAKTNCLSPNEIVTKIEIPKPAMGTNTRFKKMKRSSEDLALVGIAGLHNKSNTYLSYTAVAPTPIFVDISHFFKDSSLKLTEDVFSTIWKEVLPHINPIDDVRAGKNYRIHIAEILTRDILRDMME